MTLAREVMCMGLTLRARISHLKVHILVVNSWDAKKEKDHLSEQAPALVGYVR